MNTIETTEKPKLKLNFGSKPLILNTNVNPHVVGSALKKVVVFEKPKSDIKDAGNSPATSDKCLQLLLKAAVKAERRVRGKSCCR